jgi:hypothetical protein
MLPETNEAGEFGKFFATPYIVQRNKVYFTEFLVRVKCFLCVAPNMF